MPLDSVVISAMRGAESINIFILNSIDTLEDRIYITPDSIRWVERNFEQRIVLANYFLIDTQGDYVDALQTDTDHGEATVIRVGVREVKEKSFDVQTFNVDIEKLQLTFDETTAHSIHCSHCFNELVSVRKFGPLKEIPIYTIQPKTFFCPPSKPPLVLVGNEMFYGLNHIVINPSIFNPCILMAGKNNIYCARCLQLVGKTLSQGATALLYADTIRMANAKPEGLASETTMELFQPTKPDQLMLRLLHDAVPFSYDKTRLLLETMRPDGQLHYLLLIVDTNQVDLLCSDNYLSTELDAQLASAEEEVVNPAAGDSGSNTAAPATASTSSNAAGNSASLDLPQNLHVFEVKLRALRGCRINYQTFWSDHELSAGYAKFMLWRDMGTPMLRISFKMMIDLVNTLNANEQMVMSIERLTPQEVVGKLSYLIFETVAKSKENNPMLVKSQDDSLPTECMQDEPVKVDQHDQMNHEQLQLAQEEQKKRVEEEEQKKQDEQSIRDATASCSRPQNMTIILPSRKESEDTD